MTQPIQLRRRTVPERLDYLADQLDKAGMPPVLAAVLLGTMLGTMGTQGQEGDDGK